MDGATITGTVELTRAMNELFDLPEKDRKGIIRGVAREAAPEVLKAHYDKNKGSWAPKRDGGQQLVNTGNMMKGITSKKAPASLRKITVGKIKKQNNTYRISISLRKVVDGVNVYTFAQKGRAVSATGKTKLLGRTKIVGLKVLRKSGLREVKVNRDGARMVCQSEKGDEKFFSDRLAEGLRNYLTRKAKKVSK
jgi:hypothetical protein